MSSQSTFNIKPIRTQADYKVTLKRIYKLMQSELKVKSEEYDQLELLSILVDEYENNKYPIDLPDPIEAIKFRMEQLNLDRSDLISIIGSKSRTSEILSGKRKLSLSMIRALHNKLNIPATSLISEY